MDGRGGCCIARYSAATGGGGGGFGDISYGMSKVERIMLKYRPIVPKPMAAGSGSSSTVEHSHSYDGTRRRKRKYVRSNGGKTKKERRSTKTVSKKRKVSTSSSSVSGGGGNSVVTLPLMPETPDRKEKSPPTSSASEKRDILSSVRVNNPKNPTPIFMISFNSHQHMISTDHVMVTAPPSPQKSQAFYSVVTVECVTGTWLNGNGLGFTDKVMNMETETCPSFITDNRDTVVWTNKAYKVMTAGGGSGDRTVVVVKKVNRVTLPVAHPAFTCRVKVTWGNERDTSPATVTAPCDVWQLPTGGCAWRLDIKAALSLGWP